MASLPLARALLLFYHKPVKTTILTPFLDTIDYYTGDSRTPETRESYRTVSYRPFPDISGVFFVLRCDKTRFLTFWTPENHENHYFSVETRLWAKPIQSGNDCSKVGKSGEKWPFSGPLFRWISGKIMKNHWVPCRAQRRVTVKTPKTAKTRKMVVLT